MKQLIGLAAALVALAAAMTACDGGKFSIEGTLKDAGTQYLQAIYLSGDSLTNTPVSAVDGKFVMEGNSEELAVVYFYTSQGRLLTHVAAQNGDEIKLEGSVADNYGIAASGTDANSQWSGFIRDRAADFKAMDFKKTDKAIADFVRKNPDNVVSTLLLTCDYSDPGSAEAQKLLKSISETAKPALLLSLYSSAINGIRTPAKLSMLKLRGENDSLDIVKTRGHTLSVVYLWNSSDQDRKAVVERLKNLKKKSGDKLQIVDICLDSDTLSWRSSIRRDSSSWRHYKAVGGPVDKTVENLNVKGSPFFIVADSVGTQIYRGISAEEAEKAVNGKLHK